MLTLMISPTRVRNSDLYYSLCYSLREWFLTVCMRPWWVRWLRTVMLMGVD